MHLVEVDILICMLEDYCQYVFSRLLPLLCLQLTFFSKLFLFFLCLTHTTGSRKNKVCLLSMFMVTSRRGTSRVEIEERKKVRAAELRKYSVCVTMCLCVGNTVLCSDITDLQPVVSVVNERLHFHKPDLLFTFLVLFLSLLVWCLPLHGCGSVEVIYQSVYVLLFFSCCSVFRVITLHPSPSLLFALLISSLCCTRSVSSLLSLSHASVCVCIVWVCTNGRELLRWPPIGWQRPTRIGCTLCIVREKRRKEGGRELQQAGVRGERRWSAWVFLFWDGRVWNQERNESACLSVAHWAHRPWLHPRFSSRQRSCRPPLPPLLLLLLLLLLLCRVQLCFAALAPKCSPPPAPCAWASFRVEALPGLLVLLPPAGNYPKASKHRRRGVAFFGDGEWLSLFDSDFHKIENELVLIFVRAEFLCRFVRVCVILEWCCVKGSNVWPLLITPPTYQMLLVLEGNKVTSSCIWLVKKCNYYHSAAKWSAGC